MTITLKPRYYHALAIAIALTVTTGAPVSPIAVSPVLAAASNEPEPAPVPSSTDANKDKKKKKKKLKVKKKKKQNFGSESDRSSLEENLQEPYNPSKRLDLTLANSQIKAGQYRAAIITLNRLSRPEDANVLNLLGYSHRKLGLVDVGMRYYLAALERNPEHKGVHEYLGEAYLQKDDLAKAQVMLNKLGKICGTDCEPYQELSAAIADYKQKHAL